MATGLRTFVKGPSMGAEGECESFFSGVFCLAGLGEHGIISLLEVVASRSLGNTGQSMDIARGDGLRVSSGRLIGEMTSQGLLREPESQKLCRVEGVSCDGMTTLDRLVGSPGSDRLVGSLGSGRAPVLVPCLA